MAARPQRVIKKSVAAHQLYILHCLVSATPWNVKPNGRANRCGARITLEALHAEDIFKVHFRVGVGGWGVSV